MAKVASSIFRLKQHEKGYFQVIDPNGNAIPYLKGTLKIENMPEDAGFHYVTVTLLCDGREHKESIDNKMDIDTRG